MNETINKISVLWVFWAWISFVEVMDPIFERRVSFYNFSYNFLFHILFLNFRAIIVSMFLKEDGKNIRIKTLNEEKIISIKEIYPLSIISFENKEAG